MLLLPDQDVHGTRLRGLLLRYRAQEATLRAILDDLEDRLEHEHRAATDLQLAVATDELTLPRCRALQLQCDELATELVHVRMAVHGTAEELAIHVRDAHETLACSAAS